MGKYCTNTPSATTSQDAGFYLCAIVQFVFYLYESQLVET